MPSGVTKWMYEIRTVGRSPRAMAARANRYETPARRAASRSETKPLSVGSDAGVGSERGGTVTGTSITGAVLPGRSQQARVRLTFESCGCEGGPSGWFHHV